MTGFEGIRDHVVFAVFIFIFPCSKIKGGSPTKRKQDKKVISLTKFVSFRSIILVFFIFSASACSQYKMATLLRSNNLRTYDGPVLAKKEVGYLTGAAEARALEIAEITGE